jgi:hypothetical protein
MNIRFYIEQAGRFAAIARTAYEDFFSFCHAIGFNDVSQLTINAPGYPAGGSAHATEDFLRATFEIIAAEQKIIVCVNGHMGCDESFEYQLVVSEDGIPLWKLQNGTTTESFHSALVMTFDDK